MTSGNGCDRFKGMKNILRFKKQIIAGIVVAGWTFAVAWFFSNYFLQVPITVKFRCFACKRYTEPVKVKKPQTKAPVSKLAVSNDDPRVPEIIAKIHILESNNGTKGLGLECRNKGLVNDVGYLPTPGFCFQSEEEELLTLNRWFNKRLKTMDLVSALCLYNLGTPNLVNCKYYQDFITL